MTQNDIDLLQKTHAIDVLLAIDENPGAMKKTITRTKKAESTRFYRLRELEQEGLICVTKSQLYNTHFVDLTDRGKEIVSHLKAIKELL